MNTRLSKLNGLSYQLLLDEELRILDVAQLTNLSFIRDNELVNTILSDYITNKEFFTDPYDIFHSGIICGHKVSLIISRFRIGNLLICNIYHSKLLPINNPLSFDYYLLITNSFTILDVDEDFLLRFGFNKDFIIGKDILSFIHPDSRCDFNTILDRDSGDSDLAKISFINSLGSVTLCEMSYININTNKDGLKYLLLKDITEKELSYISNKLDVCNIIETFDLLHVPVFISDMFGGLMYKNNYATEYCKTYSSTFSQITTLSGFDFIQALYDFSHSMKSSWSKSFAFPSFDGSTNYFTIDYFLITDSFNIPSNFVLVLKENGLKHLYTTIDNALHSLDNLYFWILDNSMRCIYTNNSTTLLDFLNYDSLDSLNALLISTKAFTVNKSDGLFTISVNKIVCDHQQMILIKAFKLSDNSEVELRNKEKRSEKDFLLK